MFLEAVFFVAKTNVCSRRCVSLAAGPGRMTVYKEANNTTTFLLLLPPSPPPDSVFGRPWKLFNMCTDYVMNMCKDYI